MRHHGIRARAPRRFRIRTDSHDFPIAPNSTLIYEDAAKAPVVDPDAFIAGTGFGGPNRNSDPTIASTVNVLARLGAMVTLANPVGLYMDHIDLTGWEVPGGVAASDCARIVRGTPNMIERLVVKYPTDEFDVSDILIGTGRLRSDSRRLSAVSATRAFSASIPASNSASLAPPELVGR
jgi:hypothetical protein